MVDRIMTDLQSDDPTVADEFAIRDTMRSEELQNDFMRRHEDVLDGFRTLTGMDAVKATPDVEDHLSQYRDHLLDQTNNPNQRAMLADDLDAHMDVARSDIARHAGQQALAWERGVAQDRLDLLKRKAARDWADLARVEIYGDASETAAQARARASGFPVGSDRAKAQAALARSSLYRSAIAAALADGAHGPAIDLHGGLKDRLSEGDIASLGPEIAIAHEMYAAKDYVGRIVPSRLPATMDGAEGAHQAATQQNQADWPDNPRQLATNQHLIDIQFGRHKRGLDQIQIERNQGVQDWLVRAGADGRPQLQRPQSAAFGSGVESLPDAAGATTVVHPNGAWAECHEECLPKHELGLGGSGPDAFLRYRRCVRECMSRKGDDNYLRPPKD